MKVYHVGKDVEYWYDPHVKVWYAIKNDKDGYQWGGASDAYLKSDIIKEAERLAKLDPEEEDRKEEERIMERYDPSRKMKVK